jgi:hypothetical protein
MLLAQKHHKEQWNRIKDLGINPHSYNHLIFDKGAQNTCRKYSLFNKGAGETGYPHALDLI